MFEPLGETENEKRTGSHRGMRVIWIVVAVAVIILFALAFI
jgi:hypothetical protein